MFSPFLNMMDECVVACGCWWLHKTGTRAQCQVMVCHLVLSEQLRQPSGCGSRTGLFPMALGCSVR